VAVAALPIAGQAVVPVTKAVQEALKPLTADLVIFRGKVFREREEVVYGPDLTPKTKALRKHTRKVLEPVDLEVHVNALGVGIVGVGAIAAGIAGWLLWDGIAGPGFQIFRGAKTSPFWQEQAARLQGRIETRQEEKKQEQEEKQNEACRVLQATFNAEANQRFRDLIRSEARKQGCAWAQ